ncbi:MAG TPA: TolC family protein [Pyrinomonadaceae bacterium]|jgi:HAE1 family hydrophobic/amphiphilic exporter-1|nr:TolC family protein [Pyrinomonadaceae bacterium]
MSIKLQVIKGARVVAHLKFSLMNLRSTATVAALLLVALALQAAPIATLAQTPTTTTTTTTTPASSQQPPAGTSTTGQEPRRPGEPPPSTTELPPNSSAAPVQPQGEAQQSTQPQTGPEQERRQTTPDTTGPRPPSPEIQTPASQQNAPGRLPETSTPAGTTAPRAETTPGGTPSTGGAATTAPATAAAAPGQQDVGVSGGVAPAELPVDPPPIAPNFEAPARPLPSAERVGVDISAQVPVTLNEAIALALANNNDIDGSRINVQIAEFNLRAARGVYDPIFSSESYYESRVTPTSSTLGGAQNGSVEQTDITGAMRFGGYTPFAGGAYQLDFSSTRLTTNNQNVTLNPQYPTALTFTYTQPLWRGLRFDQNRRQIEVAKKNLSLTDSQFRQRAIEVISQVESAYWDLAFSLRNLQVQIDAVKQARVQVESNQRLVEKGVLAPIDIIAATTQVTTFEQSVYSAQEAVTRAENTLKTLILPDRAAALWSRPLTPVTPVNLEAPRVPLNEAVSAAISNRPELAQLQTSAEINQIDQRYFSDQTKPQIDLVGTYTVVGLAGSPTAASGTSGTGSNALLRARVNELSVLAGLPPLEAGAGGGAVNPNLIGGYTQSLSNLIGQDYPTYRVGVRVALPLRNRTAEANLGRSLAEGSLIRNQRAQAEQLIEADVRNATQALRSAEARLASAAASRSSAEQQYESEQRQFKAGTTTLFLVLQRQTELLAARGRELQAQTDLNKAIAEFQRATGNTLRANNVAVRTDTPARELEMRTPEASAASAPTSDAAAATTPAGPAGTNSSRAEAAGVKQDDK